MAIDERSIVQAVAGLGLGGDEEGLIPAFGLYLTLHQADYYNRISFGTARLLEQRGLLTDARTLLVEAGHVCAFNTFGGIMLSAEWEAVVAPMIETREDWIRGMVAVVNALGWGRWTIERLVPGERLEIAIADAYECAGYVRDYPRTEHARCYLATGGVAGLMNLLYHGDITARPTLTEAYYTELFGAGGHFQAEEVECLARGDARCLVVATRGPG